MHLGAYGPCAGASLDRAKLTRVDYRLYPDGRLDPPETLPQVQSDPETADTYRLLRQFLKDEEQAGLSPTRRLLRRTIPITLHRADKSTLRRNI